LQYIHIRSGSRIDQIGTTVNGHRQTFGGSGGSSHDIDVRNLCINQVTVRSGSEVDSLTFHGFYRSNRRTYQSKQFGGNGGSSHTVRLGGCLNGFIGRSGSRVDRIGFISLKEITSLRGQWKMVESYTGDINYYVEETTVKSSSKAMDKAEAS